MNNFTTNHYKSVFYPVFLIAYFECPFRAFANMNIQNAHIPFWQILVANIQIFQKKCNFSKLLHFLTANPAGANLQSISYNRQNIRR